MVSSAWMVGVRVLDQWLIIHGRLLGKDLLPLAATWVSAGLIGPDEQHEQQVSQKGAFGIAKFVKSLADAVIALAVGGKVDGHHVVQAILHLDPVFAAVQFREQGFRIGNREIVQAGVDEFFVAVENEQFFVQDGIDGEPVDGIGQFFLLFLHLGDEMQRGQYLFLLPLLKLLLAVLGEQPVRHNEQHAHQQDGCGRKIEEYFVPEMQNNYE